MKWIGTLLKNGNSILEIKRMRLSDLELMVDALEKDNSNNNEEEMTTLDKAFPFLFG